MKITPGKRKGLAEGCRHGALAVGAADEDDGRMVVPDAKSLQQGPDVVEADFDAKALAAVEERLEPFGQTFAQCAVGAEAHDDLLAPVRRLGVVAAGVGVAKLEQIVVVVGVAAHADVHVVGDVVEAARALRVGRGGALRSRQGKAPREARGRARARCRRG